MKKLLTTLLAIASIVTVVGSIEPKAQAQAYCGHCCDVDPYGNARIRCTLTSPEPCGGSCVCYGVPGSGFACY